MDIYFSFVFFVCLVGLFCFVLFCLVLFLFVCLFVCLSVTFENDQNLFWVYHCENFLGKKSGQGAPISLLAKGARHARYPPVV